MKTTMIIAIVVSFVLVGGGSFYAGIQYQKKQQNSAFPRRDFAMNGPRPSGVIGNRNGTQGSRPIMGEITSLDSNTITVSTQDQGSKLVVLSDVTKITKSSEASSSDLQVGKSVNVFGIADAAGASIQAQSISVGDSGFRLPFNQTP